MHKIPKTLLLINFINHLIRRDRLNNSFNIKLKSYIIFTILVGYSQVGYTYIQLGYRVFLFTFSIMSASIRASISLISLSLAYFTAFLLK